MIAPARSPATKYVHLLFIYKRKEYSDSIRGAIKCDLMGLGLMLEPWEFPTDLLAAENQTIGFRPDSYLIGVATASSPILKTLYSQKNPLAFANGLFFLELVPKMGLEPTHLTAYAPQTYVSTIPPPGHIECVGRTRKH